MNRYIVAHSPDADDLFMYYAIVFGWVNTPFDFQNIALDIQTLNEYALQKRYPITAISFGVYPFIAQDYALLSTGVSFGEGYGPKLIKKKGKILKKHFKVALSGQHTSNALLFRLKYPNAKIIYKNFLDIQKSVLEGEVDAGVLIHEEILNFDPSLEVETHLWDIWLELAQADLPLPLGGMAISRNLPLIKALKCEEILTKAVQIATKYKKLLSSMLLERSLVRVDSQDLETYLNLYANQSSIKLSPIQYQAIDKLFELGYNANIYPQIIQAQDCILPQEYLEFRYN
ncbi:S-ribosylhomocysteine lyase [Helicobacter enhydrae]|uniref:1,4-dihydroxy-6-naphtoate synthase n=1 Tax=Helicobacter enhydrae TaxID=222136 RepID=A0A1B1U7D0_9HELI|nr:MqnA/MqnD/SBP family protein [Helicobacter enhydrae]ANV98650.1 S-ribosylhomocysteine lyase [Helicobacter enhydrae]